MLDGSQAPDGRNMDSCGCSGRCFRVRSREGKGRGGETTQAGFRLAFDSFFEGGEEEFSGDGKDVSLSEIHQFITTSEIGRNPKSKHQPIIFCLSVENERADAERDG